MQRVMDTVTILSIAVRLIIASAASPMAVQVSVDKADRICSTAIMILCAHGQLPEAPFYDLSWPDSLEGG